MRASTGLTVLLLASLTSPLMGKTTSPTQTPNVKTKSSRRAKRTTKRNLASPAPKAASVPAKSP